MGTTNKRSNNFKNAAIDYYVSNHISKIDAAKKLGISPSSFRIWAKQLDRSDYFEIASLRGDNLSKIGLSTEQEQVILGTLLGDSCIQCREKSSRRRTMVSGHGSKQLNYLKWKHHILGGNKITPYKTGFGATGSHFSLTHPFIEEIWSNNYSGSTKCVTKWWTDRLDSLAYAVWFQDDGSSTYAAIKRKLKDGTIKTYKYPRIGFSTYAFDVKSIEVLVSGFEDKGFHVYSILTGKGPVIMMPPKPARRFIEWIRPHIILDYKLKIFDDALAAGKETP